MSSSPQIGIPLATLTGLTDVFPSQVFNFSAIKTAESLLDVPAFPSEAQRCTIAVKVKRTDYISVKQV